MSQYIIVDDFQAGNCRVLVLDRDFEVESDRLTIDGVEMEYNPNSIPNWVTIKSNLSFKGKTVVCR